MNYISVCTISMKLYIETNELYTAIFIFNIIMDTRRAPFICSFELQYAELSLYTEWKLQRKKFRENNLDKKEFITVSIHCQKIIVINY